MAVVIGISRRGTFSLRRVARALDSFNLRYMVQGHLKIARHSILVTGRVKGVGFRYHVLWLARKQKLAGFAANCVEGVWIEIEGSGDRLDFFLNSLRSNPPLFSKITGLRVKAISLRGDKEFKIASDLMSLPVE